MIIVPISLTTSLAGLFIPFFFAILDIAGMQYIDVVLYGMYYALLRKYGKPDEHGHPYITVKNSTVAKHLHTSASTIKRAKKRLQNAKLIKVVRVGYGRTSRIYLFDYRDVIAADTPEPPAASTAEEQSFVPSTGATVTPPAEADVTPPVGALQDCYSNNNNNNIIANSPSGVPENVALSIEEYTELRGIIGEHTDAFIRRYAQRKADKGYTFPNDYDALVNWWSQDREQWTAGAKRKAKNQKNPAPGKAGNSFDTDDFFDAALARSFGGMLPPSNQG